MLADFRELYDLRSAVEHLNVPLDVLQIGTEIQRILLANRSTRQADVLARGVILKVLESPALFNNWRTDQQIDLFWGLPLLTRRLLWGDQIDISVIP